MGYENERVHKLLKGKKREVGRRAKEPVMKLE
jgi:hypothetical protein